MITAPVSGKLVIWRYDVGAMVRQGEAIAEIVVGDQVMVVHAPVSGRFTEMMALPGDEIEAGKVIGWVDAVDVESLPLASLIDEPSRKTRKPQRKARTRRLNAPWLWLIVGVMTLFGALAVGVVLMLAPAEVRVESETSGQPVPVPTPRFDRLERVIYSNVEMTESMQWGMQGIVQSAGYDPDSGTWYDVRFGDELVRVAERDLDSVGVLAPTPTLFFDASHWPNTLILKEAVADFPAGTRVQISSASFNGVEWDLQVLTENNRSLNVRESQLAYPEAFTPTP